MAIKDISVEDFASNLQEAVNKSDKLRDSLTQMTGVSKQFAQVLVEVQRSTDVLPKNFRNTSDFLKKITSDSKKFKEIQSKVTEYAKDQLKIAKERGLLEKKQELRNLIKEKKAIQEAMREDKQFKKEMKQSGAYENLLKEIEKTKEDITKFPEKANKLEEESLKLIKSEFDMIEKEAKVRKDISLYIGNATELTNKLGDSIRHPAQAVDGMLLSFGSMPQKIAKIRNESESWSEVMSKIGGSMKMFAKGGLVTLGIMALLSPIILVWSAFKNLYSFIDDHVIPAQAEFNKTIGATQRGSSELTKQMQSMGTEFYNMGLDFEQGAGAVREFAKGMKSIKFDNQMMRTGVELSEILGIGGEQAGKLALQFTKAGMGQKELNDMMNVGAKEAKAYNVPINETLRDMAQAPDVMLRFGVTNRRVFAESTAKANSYGLSIKEVNQAFGKQLDTFEGSSTAAAKLNTIFGTSINSMKLMLETDPTKRLEMMRKELEKQGKSWSKLNVFEKNVITSSMGVSEEQAALILSSDKERQVLEARAAKAKENAKIDEKWNDGLKSLQKTILPLQPKIDRLLRSIAEFTLKLFGMDSSNLQTTADKIGGAIDGITKAIDNARSSIDDFKEGWDNTFSFLQAGHAEMIADMLSGARQMNDKDMANIKMQLSSNPKMAEMVERKLRMYHQGEGVDDQVAKQLVQTYSHAQDALITKDGKVIQFNPQDNILASKSTPTSTFSGASMGAGKMSGGSGGEQTINVNLYLDSKKIQTEIVKLSRY